MKTSVKIGIYMALYGYLVGAIYWFLTYEITGGLCLFVLGIAATFFSIYLWRHEPADDPADDVDPDLAATAGEVVGVFAPRSVWPVMLAMSLMVCVVGLFLGIWLTLLGLGGVLFTVVNLMRESND